jgi:hypothetical protein
MPLALLACGCTSDGHPPTARVTLSPEWLPVGDHYQTDVLLDGTASRNDVEDPTGARPLSFAWAIDDPHLQIRAGDLGAAMLTVRLAADGPTTVRLTVTDVGGIGRATVRVGVTVPEDM